MGSLTSVADAECIVLCPTMLGVGWEHKLGVVDLVVDADRQVRLKIEPSKSLCIDFEARADGKNTIKQ